MSSNPRYDAERLQDVCSQGESIWLASRGMKIDKRATLLLLLTLLIYDCFVGSLKYGSRRPLIGKVIASTSLATLFSLSSIASPIAIADQSISKNFIEFISSLEKGDVERVVFKGVRPEYCLAFFKDGTVASIREGFPAYDDPKSASGPAQAIAKCQHTPGVICEQDISETLSLSKKLKGNVPTKNRPMMSHSSYPQALKDGTYVPSRPQTL